jgi:hypothetical protein
MLNIFYILLIVNIITNSLPASHDFEATYRRQLSSLALSTKGDLPANTDNIKRRIFRMPGDGNCFLWSAGITRRKATEIWLRYANNSAIRAMGSNEIFDAFFCDELPQEMKDKSDYNELKASLIDIQSRLDDENTVIGQMAAIGVAYSNDARHAIEAEERALFNCIRHEYCTKESVYRDFVNLVLRKDSYYLFTTCDSLSNRPLFIDILALHENKNLTTYAYGPNNKSLVATHRYLRPGGANGTWEMVLQGQHYNRAVPVNNVKELEKAELDELAYLASITLPTQQPCARPLSSISAKSSSIKPPPQAKPKKPAKPNPPKKATNNPPTTKEKEKNTKNRLIVRSRLLKISIALKISIKMRMLSMFSLNPPI